MAFVRAGTGVAGVPIRIYRLDPPSWDNLAR